MSDIKFSASVDSRKGEVSLSKLDKRVDKVGKSTQRAAQGFKALASKLAVGVAAFYAASKALRGLTQWMGDAIEKAGIQEMAEKEVAAALESTGREVEKNTEHFKLYASEIQQATVYGDEQILSAQALMIQLTKLDRDGLDAATKGAIGLASVYKTDLKAAATLVGKALAGNYGALSRYGLTVERTATAEEKRTQLLEQLLVMYKRAEAETDTYQGSIKQLTNVYGDLKEEVGKAVTENESFREGIQLITSIISNFVASGVMEEWVGTLEQGWKALEKTAPWIQANISLLKTIAINLAIAAAKEKRLKEEAEAIVGIDIAEWLREQGIVLNENSPLWERAIGLVTEQKEALIALKTTIPIIEMPEFDFPKLPSEIIAEDIEKIGMVIEKDLEAEIDKIDVMYEESVENVLKSLGLWLEGTGEAYEKHKKQLQDLSSFEQMALAEMMGSYQGIIGTILGVIEKWAIGEIVKSVMVGLPFPINLLATAGAIAAVKGIFSSIKGMEKGGMVGLQGPEIVMVGERGPERIIPNNQISNIYNQGGSRITINQYNTFKNLDQYSIRQAGSLLRAEVERQIKRG